MGIGTSLGAFYRDEGHYAASKWDDRYDDNVVKPEQQETNKKLDDAEVSPSGPGMPISNVVAAPYTGSNLGPLSPLEPGNIDLNNRPEVKNGDETSTIRSKSFNFEGKETLLPTVSDDGRLMTDEEAIKQYKDTGKHLGIFDTPENADAYAGQLHATQALMHGLGTKLDYKQAAEIYNAVGNHDLPVNTPYNVLHLPFINKLLGINGEERHQLWPERMINELTETASKVAKGDVPMWAMDPETGEMHTSLDAMQAAWKMMPGANSGTITKVLDKVSQNHPPSRPMSSIESHVQEENIRNWMHDTYPPTNSRTFPDYDSYVRQPSQDHPPTSDPRGSISLPSDRMRHAEQLRQERTIPGEPSQSRYVGFTDEEWAHYNSITRSNRFPLRYNEGGSYSPEVHRTPAQALRDITPTRTSEDLITLFGEDAANRHSMNLPLRENSPPKLIREQGKIKLMTNPTGRGAYSGGGQHMFYFTNDKGAIGKVDVSILDSGKTLYVHGIKGQGNDRAPGTFGTSDMKDLVRALRKEFPDTKAIKGFRISGARRRAAQDRGDFTFRGRDASGTLTDSTKPDLSD